MKALSMVVRLRAENVWHLLRYERQTACGQDTYESEMERKLIAMVRSADLCPKCQEALANSRVSRAGLVHKKGAK